MNAELSNPLQRWRFAEWLEVGRATGEVYDLPRLDDVNDAVVTIDGRKVRNFSGIGVLGWQHDPAVREVYVQAARTYGLVVGGSRMVQGLSWPHLSLERLLAETTGRDAAITFATGMLANLGFVAGMSARFSFNERPGLDNSDVVFVLDRHSHWTMWRAVEGFRHRTNLFTFRHNDPDDLRRVLEKVRGRKLIVGFETVYSADGSVAPVGALLDLCEEFGAVSFVDDANGFLMYGNGQRRFASEYDDLRRADFLMLALGKAVGITGGALVGPADAIEAFRYLAGTTIFTTNLQPTSAAAAGYVVERMRNDPSIADRYLDRVDAVRADLTAIGCMINPTPTYVTSVALGSDRTAITVREEFLRRGYLVPVFRYPAVRRNRAVLRLLINDRLSDTDLAAFVETLGELKHEYGF